MSDENGWGEYKRLVIDTLSRLELGVKELDSKLDEINNQVLMMKVKIALFSGGIAFVVTAVTTYIIDKFLGGG